jgi:hypothetical protein
MLPKLNQTLEQARTGETKNKPEKYIPWPQQETDLKAPESIGDMPGYQPSHRARSETKLQAQAVQRTRSMERRTSIKDKLKIGAAIAIAAGVTAGAVKIGDHIAQEHAPWDRNTPTHPDSN